MKLLNRLLLSGLVALTIGLPALALPSGSAADVTVRLNEIEAQLYRDVEVVCEIALNRLESANRAALAVPNMQTITLDELIACIKRIRSSISLWTKDYGRRGYLDFIADFNV